MDEEEDELIGENEGREGENVEEEEEEEEEGREEEKNEDDGWGVDTVGNKDSGRGGQGVRATTPYAVSRTGRRSTSKR